MSYLVKVDVLEQFLDEVACVESVVVVGEQTTHLRVQTRVLECICKLLLQATSKRQQTISAPSRLSHARGQDCHIFSLHVLI